MLVAFLSACARAPHAPPDRPDRRDRQNGDSVPPRPPVAPVAARGLGLVIGFHGLEASAAFRETLVRQLARRLRTTYRTEVYALGVKGSPALDPETFLALVESGADDAVLVRVNIDPLRPERVQARVQIVVLDTRKVRYDLKLENLRGRADPRPPPERLADLIALRIQNRWIDREAAPKVDLLRAANHLAARGACAQAMQLYARVFADPRPTSGSELRRRVEGQRHRDACQGELVPPPQ